jgi:hypothetical protein
MRFRLLSLSLFLVALTFAVNAAETSAQDYEERFVRNYPPGYYGMWYKSERFVDDPTSEKVLGEYYRWDTFMSALTGVVYPFNPAPFDWEYGAGRKFNLPDYNSNDWR